MSVFLTKNGNKYEVEGFPRHIGPTPGHLSECRLVSLAWVAEQNDRPWPPDPRHQYVVYCTCDDWSPE